MMLKDKQVGWVIALDEEGRRTYLLNGMEGLWTTESEAQEFKRRYEKIKGKVKGQTITVVKARRESKLSVKEEGKPWIVI